MSGRRAWIGRRACGCVVMVASTESFDVVRDFMAEVAEHQLSAAVEDFDQVKQEPTFLGCPHREVQP